MKKWLIGFLSLPLFSLAQEGKDFTISGFLKGLPENTEIVVRNEDLSPNPLATTTSKTGKFLLKGKIPEANLYYLTFTGSQQKFYLFVEPANMKLEGHMDSLPAIRVTGSSSQADFVEFNKQFNASFTRLSQLAQQINSGEADPQGVTRNEYNALAREINVKTDKFVEQHKKSVVSPFAIMVISQLSEDISIKENRYKLLDPVAQESYFGRMLNQNITESKIGAVGTPAIEFIQNDTTGMPVSLSSFRGKYVLIDFWASWCRPCREENPNVVDVFRKYSTKNFTVLGVSLDRAREPWLKAIRDDKLTWTHVSDLKYWQNEVAAQYKVSSIPQNFLIDPNGKIIAKNLRGAELQSKLQSLLQ
jgi:peroxiredoxin